MEINLPSPSPAHPLNNQKPSKSNSICSILSNGAGITLNFSSAYYWLASVLLIYVGGVANAVGGVAAADTKNYDFIVITPSLHMKYHNKLYYLK